jgi:hypothetical protein
LQRKLEKAEIEWVQQVYAELLKKAKVRRNTLVHNNKKDLSRRAREN